MSSARTFAATLPADPDEVDPGESRSRAESRRDFDSTGSMSVDHRAHGTGSIGAHADRMASTGTAVNAAATVLTAFTMERVHFVVVGAHAARAHGIDLASTGLQDAPLELAIEPSPVNRRAVVAAVARCGAPQMWVGECDARIAVTMNSQLPRLLPVLPLLTASGNVTLLTAGPSPAAYRRLIRGCKVVRLDGVAVYVPPLTELTHGIGAGAGPLNPDLAAGIHAAIGRRTRMPAVTGAAGHRGPVPVSGDPSAARPFQAARPIPAPPTDVAPHPGGVSLEDEVLAALRDLSEPALVRGLVAGVRDRIGTAAYAEVRAAAEALVAAGTASRWRSGPGAGFRYWAVTA